MTTRAAELERLCAELDRISLEQYLERRQIDRQLERIGIAVTPTPKPRFRSRPKATTAAVASTPGMGRQVIVRPCIGRVLDVR
jgi:hypothetical protein